METATFAGTTSSDGAGAASRTGTVVGVPTSAGSPHEGSENGPYFLRRVSQHLTWGYDDGVPLAVDTLEAMSGWVDGGDLELPDGADAEKVASAVRREVADLARLGVVGLVGGDHSITAGAVEALVEHHPDLWVVQLDHHLDVQIWDHGPLDPLFHTNVMSHVGRWIRPGHLLQLGLAPFVAAPGGSLDDVRTLLSGMGRQVSSVAGMIDDDVALAELLGRDRAVYVTVDLDVLQPEAMSSTGYPATTGLSLGRVVQLLRLLSRANTIVGFDVVEFSADRDDRSPVVLADAGRAAVVLAELMRCSSPAPTRGEARR
ncbi:MAG: arginase family protein [Propionibacteriales bacterium]|nr:arginase family protein [Propionibacteriales bacterium]